MIAARAPWAVPIELVSALPGRAFFGVATSRVAAVAEGANSTVHACLGPLDMAMPVRVTPGASVLVVRVVEALLDAMLEYQTALFDEILGRIGPYLSVVMIGSDLGTQRAPTMSEASYTRLVLPRYKKFVASIKAKTEAKVFYHSCGSLYPLIKHLLDAGVDVLQSADSHTTISALVHERDAETAVRALHDGFRLGE